MPRDQYGYGSYGESKALLMVFTPILLLILVGLAISWYGEYRSYKERKDNGNTELRQDHPYDDKVHIYLSM